VSNFGCLHLEVHPVQLFADHIRRIRRPAELLAAAGVIAMCAKFIAPLPLTALSFLSAVHFGFQLSAFRISAFPWSTPVHPAGPGQRGLDLRPLERDRTPDFVIGQNSALHPVIYGPNLFPQPPRDLRFVNVTFPGSITRSHCYCLIRAHRHCCSLCHFTARHAGQATWSFVRASVITPSFRAPSRPQNHPLHAHADSRKQPPVRTLLANENFSENC